MTDRELEHARGIERPRICDELFDDLYQVLAIHERDNTRRSGDGDALIASAEQLVQDRHDFERFRMRLGWPRKPEQLGECAVDPIARLDDPPGSFLRLSLGRLGEKLGGSFDARERISDAVSQSGSRAPRPTSTRLPAMLRTM